MPPHFPSNVDLFSPAPTMHLPTHSRPVGAVVIVAALVAIMMALHSTPVVAQGKSLVVITSQDAGPYQETIAGFQRYLNQQGIDGPFTVHSLRGDATTAGQVLSEVKKAGAHLLLTVGSLATQAALKEASEIPIIACMVVNTDGLQQAANATAVVTDFPLVTQFQWMQRFLPGYNTVGVLFNPKENHDKIKAAALVAHDLGLTLVAREVETPQALPAALESLAKDTDVLWGVTDQLVLSPETSRALLLFSFRNRIPFAGLSSSWVKAGALYALDRDYTDLGAQCGEMALKVLNGTRASALLPASPRKVMYTINLRTAQYMKLDLPQALIDGAQQVFQ